MHTNIGPLKNELQFQKPQIIERVNEAFGEVVISEVVIQ
ncbi:DciA family protein [Shewanella algae]